MEFPSIEGNVCLLEFAPDIRRSQLYSVVVVLTLKKVTETMMETTMDLEQCHKFSMPEVLSVCSSYLAVGNHATTCL
jgi:hypothetical protein